MAKVKKPKTVKVKKSKTPALKSSSSAKFQAPKLTGFGGGKKIKASSLMSPLSAAKSPSVVKSSLISRASKPPPISISGSNFDDIGSAVSATAKSPKGYSLKKVGSKVKKGFSGNAASIVMGAADAIGVLASNQTADKKLAGVVRAGIDTYNPAIRPLFTLGAQAANAIFGKLWEGGGERADVNYRGQGKKTETTEAYKARKLRESAISSYRENFAGNQANERDFANSKQLYDYYKKFENRIK